MMVCRLTMIRFTTMCWMRLMTRGSLTHGLVWVECVPSLTSTFRLPLRTIEGMTEEAVICRRRPRRHRRQSPARRGEWCFRVRGIFLSFAGDLVVFWQ